jgi:hypothetical protein
MIMMDQERQDYLKLLEDAAGGSVFARLSLAQHMLVASRDGFWLTPFVIEWDDDLHTLTITRPKNWTREVAEWWKRTKLEVEQADLGQRKAAP